MGHSSLADIRITALNLSRPVPDGEETNLAWFNCDLGPVTVRGLALRRFKSGSVLAVLPRCKSQSCQFRFVDRDTQVRVTDAALVVFRALGGRITADTACGDQGT